MKPLLLLVAAIVAPALAQTSAPTVTPAPAKFDWKLRLTKGQTWTQTVTTNTRSTLSSVGPKSNMEMNLRQTIHIKDEVLDATPSFYSIRLTYTDYAEKNDVKVGGKALPSPLALNIARAFQGASFTVKQAPNGRVLDVTGLEDFLAREKKLFATIAKTPQERATLAQLTPSAESVRASIVRAQQLSLPPTPLAVGQSYSYASSFPLLMAVPTPMQISGRRTLRTLDGQSATFDESSTFTVGSVKPLLVGKVRMYMAMKGEVSGSSAVQVASGLFQSLRVTNRITGKITVVDAVGKHTTVPIDATTETTISTQFGAVVLNPRAMLESQTETLRRIRDGLRAKGESL